MRQVFGIVALWGLAGCGTPWVEDTFGEWRTLRTTMTTNRAGNFSVSLKPRPDETAMLLTLRPDNDLVDGHVRVAQAGNRVVFLAAEEVERPQSLTNAGFLGHTVSFNWPITDGFLLPQRHSVQFGLVDRELRPTSGTAEVSVVLKRDLDLEQGRVKVNVVFAGNTRNDPAVVDAVQRATDVWVGIYQGANLGIDVEYFDWNGSGFLQAPGIGNLAEYEEIAAQTPFGGLNLVILEDIVGMGEVYGFAGDIPGPLVVSGRSAVAVSMALAGGVDGNFDAGDVQLLGETMAHETGHFLGLFHPVEATFQQWDALEDTLECTSEAACIDLMGDNLMFPYPDCNSNGCVSQTGITVDQAMVTQRYTGVL